MIKVFAELHNPYTSFKELTYEDNVLNIKIQLKGCQNLDEISVEKIQATVTKEKNEKMNYWAVNIAIANPAPTIETM